MEAGYCIHLTQNMRVDPKEVEFSKYILSIGEGRAQVFPNVGDQVIKVPDEFLVRSLSELIAKIFPRIEEGYKDKYYVAPCAILTPKNENVDKINAQVMSLFPVKVLCLSSLTLLQKRNCCRHI